MKEFLPIVKKRASFMLFEKEDLTLESLNLYNEIKALTEEEFSALLELLPNEAVAIKTTTEIEGESKAKTDKIPLRNILIQSLLSFDPELNKDEEEIDRRINYLDKLMGEDIQINNNLHFLTRTALELAVGSRSVKIVGFLIEKKGANPQYKRLKYIIGLLQGELGLRQDEIIRFNIKEILRKIAKVVIDNTNPKECKIVYDCVVENKIEFPDPQTTDYTEDLLKELSQTNIKVLEEDAKNCDGENDCRCCQIMYHAIMNNQQVLIQKLLDIGADIDVCIEDSYTGLQWAIMENNMEIIELFIRNGADLSAQTYYGETTLGVAVFFSAKIEVVELLLKHGADVNERDNNGETPLDIAKNKKEQYLKLQAEIQQDLRYRYNTQIECCTKIIELLEKAQMDQQLPTRPDNVPSVNNPRKRKASIG